MLRLHNLGTSLILCYISAKERGGAELVWNNTGYADHRYILDLIYQIWTSTELVVYALLSHIYTVVECRNLRNPNNGQIIFTNGFQVGSVATYECFGVYILQGEATQTCLANGTWTGSPPTCVCKFMAIM